MSSILEFIDIERQVHRESEGQDTITPLTNTAFLKQLNKLKHQYGSNRTINSIASSHSNNTPPSTLVNRYSSLNDQIDASSDTSLKSSGPEYIKKKSIVPESFLNLFRTRSESRSAIENANSVFGMLDRSFFDSNSTTNCYTEPPTNAKGSTNRMAIADDAASNFKTSIYQQSHNLNHSTRAGSLLNINAPVGVGGRSANPTDQMFDALSSILINTQNVAVAEPPSSKTAQTSPTDPNANTKENREKFIENVKLIVKQSELIKKHKISKSIFICRALTFLMFLFMFLFVMFFLHTISSIWQSFLLEDNDDERVTSTTYIDNNVYGNFSTLVSVANDTYFARH
jgi:hypothetical protein